MGIVAWVRRLRTQPNHLVQRELMCAQLALFRQARIDGLAALAAHADPRQSPILRGYKHLHTTPCTLALLCETMTLLARPRTAADLEILIDAWIEIEEARKHVPVDERDLLHCVRAATVAFHAGSSPEQAMRVGRRCLSPSAHSSTTDLTLMAQQLAATTSRA